MALLSPAGQRITSAAGLPISGGKAQIYDVNTTTLSAVFSNAAMSTPLTNPVVADANGWLPAIFAAEGSYDIAHLSAGGVVLKSWEDWPTYTASGAGNIERVLSGSRVLIDGGDIGTGPTGVRINAGSPSPDDVGGYLRLGGWEGTQGDELDVDFATVDFLQPKSFHEDGKRLSRLLQTAATSFTTQASVAVPLTNDPLGTRRFKVTFYDLDFSSDVAVIQLRLAYDGVPTLKSGANDYGWNYVQDGAAASTDNLDTRIVIHTTSYSSATNPVIIEFDLITPDSGSANTVLWGWFVGANEGSTVNPPVLTNFTGIGYGAYGRATHVALVPSTGTVSGSYRVEQGRGFGE